MGKNDTEYFKYENIKGLQKEVIWIFKTIVAIKEEVQLLDCYII